MERVTQLAATMVVPGEATGELLASAQPLSLWGGLDPSSGEIIDRRHDLTGACVTGRILAVPRGRGSCSASGVLLEAICNGTGPAGIVISQIDPIIGLGSILADELHGLVVPVAMLAPGEFALLRTGDFLYISASGQLTVSGR